MVSRLRTATCRAPTIKRYGNRSTRAQTRLASFLAHSVSTKDRAQGQSVCSYHSRTKQAMLKHPAGHARLLARVTGAVQNQATLVLMQARKLLLARVNALLRARVHQIAHPQLHRRHRCRLRPLVSHKPTLTQIRWCLLQRHFQCPPSTHIRS